MSEPSNNTWGNYIKPWREDKSLTSIDQFINLWNTSTMQKGYTWEYTHQHIIVQDYIFVLFFPLTNGYPKQIKTVLYFCNNFFIVLPGLTFYTYSPNVVKLFHKLSRYVITHCLCRNGRSERSTKSFALFLKERTVGIYCIVALLYRLPTFHLLHIVSSVVL